MPESQLTPMNPTRIIVHCSDSKNGERVDISEITKWHMARGFLTVGYHLVIQPDGEVQKGRPLNAMGAHVEGENFDSIGICLVGKDKFPQRQLDALRYQIDSIILIYPINLWRIYCHYQFPSAIQQGKTCPNVEINKLLAWYIGMNSKALEENILYA